MRVRQAFESQLKSQRGMTLIEVMVASALWVLTGTIIAGVLFGTVRTQETILDLQSRYHGGRIALERLKRELNMAFVSLHQSDDKRTETIFDADNDRVLFTTSAHEVTRRNVRQSDQIEVEYRVERVRDPKGNDTKALTRRVKYTIDSSPGKGGRTEALVYGVKDFELEFYDLAAEDWRSEWKVEIQDAAEMRVRLRELQTLRETLDEQSTASDDVATNLAATVTAGAVDSTVAKQQAELMDGLVLPSRVKIRLVLEDPEERDASHVLETQVEIGMTDPLWY